MIGDIERQRLSTLEAHHANLEEDWKEHKKNIYQQISTTDEQIATLTERIRTIEATLRNTQK